MSGGLFRSLLVIIYHLFFLSLVRLYLRSGGLIFFLMLKFVLQRSFVKGAMCTLGRLSLNDTILCDTLEPISGGLLATSSLSAIQAAKKRGKVAIPGGLYRLQLGFSPRFSARPFYKECGGGLLPRIMAVPGFSGVLVHCGNSVVDTSGCVLVGRAVGADTLVESQKTYARLMRTFWQPANKSGEIMFLEVIN